MGMQVCRESFNTNGKSLLEAIAEPWNMSEEELDAALPEARRCAQLLCDKLSLAVCFEETAASGLCKSVLPSNFEVLRLPDSAKYVCIQPVLYYCAIDYMPRKCLALPKGLYKSINSLRNLFRKCNCDAAEVEGVSHAHSMFTPAKILHEDHCCKNSILEYKCCELSAYRSLFKLLSNDDYLVIVPSGVALSGSNNVDFLNRRWFLLLNDHIPPFSFKEELEVKLNIQCPYFERIKVEVYMPPEL